MTGARHNDTVITSGEQSEEELDLKATEEQ